jgi:hypothetical protein
MRSMGIWFEAIWLGPFDPSQWLGGLSNTRTYKLKSHMADYSRSAMGGCCDLDPPAAGQALGLPTQQSLYLGGL